MVAVLTAADLPLVGDRTGRLYEPLAREEVVYAGQPVALVVAESEALAEDGAQLVEVELDPLEPVLDLEAAARPGAPLTRVRARAEGDGSDIGDAHASVSAGGIEDEELSENVLGHGQARSTATSTPRSPPARWWSAARSRRRGCTRATSSPRPRPPGSSPTASSWSSPPTQAPFATRDSLAKLFGLPVERIRVRSTPLGGAFGGKMMIIEPLVGVGRARAAPAGAPGA